MGSTAQQRRTELELILEEASTARFVKPAVYKPQADVLTIWILGLHSWLRDFPGCGIPFSAYAVVTSSANPKHRAYHPAAQ